MSNKHQKYKLIGLLHSIAILDPKGWVAIQQKELIITVVSLMLIAVIPVLFMTFLFAWKYRAGNAGGKYLPKHDQNKKLQLGWVFALCAIVFILANIAWKSSHVLDPRKSLESNADPITIQVVALQWKWLFIYPEQNIATINYIRFPEDVPINFEITADAPMNSFWIPQLGGQMYAMNGMRTKLHLIADEIGSYRGMSSNISGEGFSGMKFEAEASSEADFDAWVKNIQSSAGNLNYEELSQASENNPVAYFRPPPNLFDSIIMKFMSEEHSHVR